MQISEFGKILVFLILGVLFVLAGYAVNKLLRKDNPTPEKLTSYECGEEPTGNSWLQFNIRFYVVALIFLLFDVEIIFIFPWATVFGDHGLIAENPQWGWFSLVEMFIFIGILIIGLMFVWVKGDLEWVKPQPVIPKTSAGIPKELYQKINDEKYRVKMFTVEQPGEATPAAEPTVVRKHAFRPTILKK